MQTGFVRSYALLLIAGFAGLALYFLIAAAHDQLAALDTRSPSASSASSCRSGSTGWWATLGAVVTLGLAIALVAGFDSGAAGLQDTVDVTWISGLGVDYSLGVDGLNVFLVLLTDGALGRRRPPSPRSASRSARSSSS